MSPSNDTEHCQPLALGMAQAARCLGISQRTLFTLVKSGGMPHIRIGRRVLFRRESLDAWLHDRETDSAARGKP